MVTPAPGKRRTVEDLPRREETQVLAFIRDPGCLFAFWEVAPESVESVRAQLAQEYAESGMFLAVFRTGDGGGPRLVREIRVEAGEMNRYVPLDGAGEYFLEIGLKAPSGRWLAYARSNPVTTLAPTAALIDPPDPDDGMVPGLSEYYAALGMLEAFPHAGPSSVEVQKRREARYAASHRG